MTEKHEGSSDRDRTPFGTALGICAVIVTVTAAHGQAQPTWAAARIANVNAIGMIAYDTTRERLVFCGSGPYPTQLSATWEFDGTRWIERQPVVSPPLRANSGMAYDASRQRVVMFGGITGSTLLDELWEYDGNTWQRIQTTVMPGARMSMGMTYDAARQCILMHGGVVYNNAVLSDTWTWDGTSWTNRALGSPTLYGHALAFDSKRGLVVAFGSYGSSSETAEWDGIRWTIRQPATSPPARSWHGLAYDGQRQRTVLRGGWSASSSYADTWEWDGTNWSLAASGGGPPTTTPTKLAFDSRSGRVIAYHQLLISIWQWDGVNWTALPAQFRTAPPLRWGAAIAYDAARQRTVMFGGSSNGSLDDTWEWDGTAWYKLSPAAKPFQNWGQAMAYDSARQRVVLLSGGVTWIWDGSNWTVAAYAISVPARWNFAMAYDSARQRVVMFGGAPLGEGYAFNDTWEWDGVSPTWSKMQPLASPPGNWSGHAMVYDATRRRMVMFGSPGAPSAASAQTWEYDGTTWHQKSPAKSPRTLWYHAMALDADRQMTVLFGGSVQGNGWDSVLGETWEWDGTTWTERTPAWSPSARAGHAMAYDSTRRQAVMFGGTGGSSGTPIGTWTYGLTTPASTTPYGTACASTPRLPVLTGGVPYLGNSGFVLDVLSARASSACAFALADQQDNLALGSCTLYVKGTLVMLPAATNSAGFASLALPVPPDPALRGAALYSQAFTLDPQNAPFGLAATTGSRLLIGD